MDYKITIDNKNVIYRDKRQSILECLEADNIEVHYHCRDGFCGACRVRLNRGEICYPNGDPLAFVGDGEILTCCCYPTSDISITID